MKDADAPNELLQKAINTVKNEDKREDGVIGIQGKTYDGSSARVTIKGEEVRYYGKQRTLAAIRAGQCRPPALRP